MAEDLGRHQLKRLVELLTLRECQDLRAGLARPEEDVLAHLQRLSPENNDLGLQRRRRSRDTSVQGELRSLHHFTPYLVTLPIHPTIHSPLYLHSLKSLSLFTLSINSLYCIYTSYLLTL